MNNLKLTLITVFTLMISAVLIYFGLKPAFRFQLSASSTPQPSVIIVEPLKNVASASAAIEDISSLVKVTKVVDGDTIEVETAQGLKKVRFIGINTPETVDPRRPVQCFGREASNETKRLLDGKMVLLKKDISETDKYQRFLRFIYLPDSSTPGQYLFVNDYLVRMGFANVSTYPPDVKYADQFLAAQKEAQARGRGLWKSCRS